MNVTLVVVKASGESKEIVIPGFPLRIGRDKACLIRIPASSVSRIHCVLTIENEELMVRDNNSSNGTYVNGERVKSHELVPGDLLALGPAVFVIKIDGHPASVDPVESFAAGAVADSPLPLRRRDLPRDTDSGSDMIQGIPKFGQGATPPKPQPNPQPAKKDSGAFKPLVSDDADDSDFDFDLKLDD